MIEALDLDVTVRMTGGEVRLRVTDADLAALTAAQRNAVTGSVHQVLELLLRPALDTTTAAAPGPTPQPVGPVAPAPERDPSLDPAPGADVGHSTKQLLLDHLLDHGPVEDRHGDAALALFAAAGVDVGKSARSRHLFHLDESGLIERTQPTPKRTSRIAATALAAQARAERTGPWARSTGDLVLADLDLNGPMHDPKGGAATLLFQRAGIDVAPSVRADVLNGLHDEGLIERRRSATKTYWIAAIGHGDGTEPPPPTPAEKVRPNTLKADLLDDLRAHGPVTDDRGKASATLAVRAGRGEVSAQKVAQAIRELVRDGLAVRRGNATKTYGLAVADDEAALDEMLATPDPEADTPEAAPEPTPAPARRLPPRDTGPAIEGRTPEKPPAPAVAPVAHQGYQVIEVIEEADIDLPDPSEDDRRERATEGAWPEDFLA